MAASLGFITLTEVVHNQWLTPPGSVRALAGRSSDARIEQQVINLAMSDFVDRLLRKRPDIFRLIQLARQHRQLVGGAVKRDRVKGGLGTPNVPGA